MRDAAPSALAPPVAALDALRRLPTADRVSSPLHRLTEHSRPWWFASTGVGAPARLGGRFDLAAPEGTCYLAEQLDGALCEKLLRTPKRVVPAERLSSLFHASVEVGAAPRTADLTSRLGTGVGLNAEIHVGLDYATTRAWARMLHRAGWTALSYLLRGDVALRARALALFGRAGLHRRAPAGMRTTVRPLDVAEAGRLLAARGVRIASMRVVPPTVEPPRS